MRWMLHLRNGDSEQGSEMQERTRGWIRRDTRMRQKIKHKAQLLQVQALYTRATYYLVSNYKAISHQA
jgi:hypothetical protein